MTESLSASHSMESAISKLYEMQSKIYQGLEQMDALNDKYKSKQEKSFINTFLHVMDRMSNQLEQAHENYKNIDEQISADKKCIVLKKQLQFFKTQCMHLRQQFQNVQAELGAQKKYQQKLRIQNDELSEHLSKKCRTIQKYRSISERESIYSKMNPKHQLLQTIGASDSSKPKKILGTIQTPVTLEMKQNEAEKGKQIFLSQHRTDRHRRLVYVKQGNSQVSRQCHTAGIKYKSSPKKKSKGLQLLELTKLTIV